jgi:hypothetical protein
MEAIREAWAQHLEDAAAGRLAERPETSVLLEAYRQRQRDKVDRRLGRGKFDKRRTFKENLKVETLNHDLKVGE